MPLDNERQYLNLLQEVLSFGVLSEDRTGTGTRSIFGGRMEFYLTKGFPLLTTKKVHWKSIVHELLWFIRGDTNIKYLNDNGVTIWDEWANEDGDCGRIYGKQWRSWLGFKYVPARAVGWDWEEAGYHRNPIDQLANVIKGIKTNPFGRRHIVTAWNPGEIDDMALPPCHMMFQFYVRNGLLDCQMYQRSCDMFLGVPFNIASYALLLHIVARMTGLTAHRLIWVGGDCHIYNDHIAQCKEQLRRQPYIPPWVAFKREDFTLDDLTFDDIELVEYKHHPLIKANVSK